MNFKEAYALVKDIQSTTNRTDCEAVFYLAREIPSGGVIIETGTGDGRTTAVIALATMNRDIRIITIDDYSESKRYGKKRGEWSINCAKKSLNRLGLSNIDFVSGMTSDYLKKYDGKVDMIYLDDCHLYSVVKEEIILSQSLVDNGIIAGHDYNNWYSEGIAVSKAVDELFDKSKVKITNTVWSTLYCKEDK